MRASLVLLVWAVLAVPLSARAQDTSASVERYKQCDAATKGKHLTDEQYRVYMGSCLASEGPPRDPFESARSIEKRCNTVANERQLSGQDRVLFMQTCRTKG
ncbi:MAG TPA: hypothetical protein VME21_18520 [Steroidobacteraceae bacterium]|nr:hypothetical protein [Steroidobacteraceae bacterium]